MRQLLSDNNRDNQWRSQEIFSGGAKMLTGQLAVKPTRGQSSRGRGIAITDR